MFFFIYVSAAVNPFTSTELIDLLVKSRDANAAADITGMLLYKKGNFLQLLEGDEEAVRSLYARIRQDPRHRKHLSLLEGNIEERQFPTWSMGFRDLADCELPDVPGYSDFMTTPLTGDEFSLHPTRAQKLLLMFKGDIK